jgi:ligand-binding SRPBCC domain-containing protein
MPKIHLKTLIKAPAELCFDLSRSVDVHMESTSGSRERAVAGVTCGMMELDDTVTWEAIHFGICQRLTSKITAFDRPRMFVDEMLRGAFNHWQHMHLFESREDGTLMIDEVDYASPLGILGRMVDAVFIKDYMTRFLIVRNDYIKNLAEAQCRVRSTL